MNLMKRCTSCGERKDVELDYYHFKRKLASGEVKEYPRSRCKDCDKALSNAWNKANRARVNQNRKPDTRDVETRRKYQREYYRDNRSKGTGRVWKKYQHEAEPRVPKGPLVDLVLETKAKKRAELMTRRFGEELVKKGHRRRLASHLQVTTKELEYLERIARANHEVKRVPLSLVDRIYTALGLVHRMHADYAEYLEEEAREARDTQAA